MNGFVRIPSLLKKARSSGFWLWVLNLLLGRLIPFNRLHGVRILTLGADRVQATAPYRRHNQNHLNGMHACCIATVAEFSSGVLFLSKLDARRYRLIMAGLEIEYHYQAMGAIVATTVLSDVELKTQVLKPLAEHAKVQTVVKTDVHDPQGNLVATARITWQIKSWDKVQTRLA